MNNWISDLNKFKLAGPPQWFLQRLMDFDDSLVVIPSRQGFYYRLAQRRKLNLSEKMVQEALFQQSDTQMLAAYGLVPVTTILSTVNWGNPFIFEELSQRAPWRQGGHVAVNQRLDDLDMKKDLDAAAKNDEHQTYLSKDAWKLYRKKIGLGRTIFLPSDRLPTYP